MKFCCSIWIILMSTLGSNKHYLWTKQREYKTACSFSWFITQLSSVFNGLLWRNQVYEENIFIKNDLILYPLSKKPSHTQNKFTMARQDCLLAKWFSHVCKFEIFHTFIYLPLKVSFIFHFSLVLVWLNSCIILTITVEELEWRKNLFWFQSFQFESEEICIWCNSFQVR